MSTDVACGNGASRDREGLLAGMVGLAPRFPPILLGEIGQAELFRRYDTKYAVAGSALPALFQRALGHYRVLEVQGLRVAPYETVYYDTPGLELYLAHYERRFPRAKVRVRTYQDTGRRFLETKVRESRRWSTKERWPLDQVPPHLLVAPVALPPLDVTRGPVHLVPVVTVSYHRLTLVARDAVERVTVDVGLRLERGGEATSYPSAAVVEVKQPAPGPSPMADALASLGFRARGLSKYCLGIAALGNGARTARFQPLVHHLQHLGSSHGERAET
jgi:hypothetical protein